jgi:carboxylesterase type B
MTMLTMGPLETPPAAREVIIQTAHGAMRGTGADGVNTFKGVPYAAPPFGPNRLRSRGRSNPGAAYATPSPPVRCHPSCSTLRPGTC